MSDVNDMNEENTPKGRETNAEHMHAADVKAIISEVWDVAQATVSSLQLTNLGLKCTETQDLLNRLVNALRSGPQADYARKNRWLKEYKADFLKKNDDELTPEDRRALAELYEAVTEASAFTESYSKFVALFNNEVIWRAYNSIRFYWKMKDTYKADDISRIGNAFAEYDEIFKRYNNSGIYKELHVSKTNNTFEENYEMVLDHMDDALVSSKYIGEFLLSTKQTAAYEINRLHHLDRETKGFDSFGSKEDTLKSALDQSSSLMDTLNKFFVAYRPPVQSLFECYSAPLEAMQEVLRTALDVIGQFKSNTSEAPYAILHYDPAVKKVASAYLSMSLGDPVTEGTRYNEMAGKMLQRCKELAKTVAKLSP